MFVCCSDSYQDLMSLMKTDLSETPSLTVTQLDTVITIAR